MGLPTIPKLATDQSIDQCVNAFQEALCDINGKASDQFIQQLETTWNASTERFKDLAEFAKKARQDSQSWTATHLNVDEKTKEKNAALLKMFYN